jgi:hypothetical protein
MDEETVYRKFTESFDIYVDGEKISWIPGYESLVAVPGTKALKIARSIEQYIDVMSNGSLEISVTPTGPFLGADVTDPHTVIWALYSLYGDSKIKIEGDAPTLEEMEIDDEIVYGEDNKPVVY